MGGKVVIYYCSCCFDNLNYGSETQKCATKTLLQKKKITNPSRARNMRLRLTDYTHTRVNTQVLPALMQSAAKKSYWRTQHKKEKRLLLLL